METILENNEKKLSAVFNLETAWQWHDKNVSGFIEYFHNAFGQKNIGYTLDSLSTELNQRISRRQLFSTGKNYLAYGLRISWSALLQISPLLISNINDHSGLFFFAGNL